MGNSEHVMKPSEDQHSASESGVAGGFCPHSQEYEEPPQVCFKQQNAGDLPKSTETWSDDHLPIDIILLTVENCDFLSCFSLLDKPFKSYQKEIGYVYFGGIGDTSDQEKLKIALVKCHKGAATPGGSLTAVLNAVRVLRPKAAFSVGTCISLGLEKVKMGDVVISCTLTAEGFRTPVSPLLSCLIQDAPYGWVAPLQNPDEMEVKVHCDGDILSQSLREKCRCDDVFERYPGAVAIETEGEGLYAAAYDANIEWVIVKGVASYFHQSQSATSEWLSFASTMAASMVAKMLKDPTVFREWPHYNEGVRYGTSEDQRSLRRSGDKIIKVLIRAAKLRKEQQEKAEKILTQLAQIYEEFNDVSKDNGEEALEAFIEYIISAYDLVLIAVGKGSVIIILECIALESLERLWNDYVSGRLDEVAERYLVTDKMKKELKLETNCLKTTIHKENYLNCKKALMELPSTYSDAAQVERKKRASNEDRAAAAVKVPSQPIRKNKRRAAAVKVLSPPMRKITRRAAAVKVPSQPIRKNKRKAAAVKVPSPPIRKITRRAAAVKVPFPPKPEITHRDTLQGLSKLLHEFPYFVNRKTDELSHIVKCLDPENKQCQGVFIDGAPGIGKTTLATEAANKLRNDNRHVLVAYIDCMEIKSFDSFAATVIEQICPSPAVEDPAPEIKKRLVASKGYFYILFLDNFECFTEENNKQQEDQPSTAAASCRDYRERVVKFIGEIARRPTNVKFLVTSSEIVAFPRLAMERIHLNPFDKDESSKLLEKVPCADRMSVAESEELCKSCSGIPLVLHTLISLQEDLKCFVKSPPEERTNFLSKMKTVPEDDKIEVCLNHCFQRLTQQAQLTLLSLCLYKGLFTPDKAAQIFCSPESSEHNLRAIVLELGRCNLLHLQKFQDTNKYTFLTIIREHFNRKAKRQEYGEKIQHARGLLIDYLISFLKETFKVFLGKNSVKSAIDDFLAEKENLTQLVEWIDEIDEERVKKCIDVFNVAGEMLAKMMGKLNYRNVYESLAKKSEEMGDDRRLAECLTSLGIKEIFNCICTAGLCGKAIERARPSLEKADRIQTHLQVNKGNSRAQCLAKLGRCLVRTGETEPGKAKIEEAIRIRKAAVQTPDDHEEEGGENVCHVMLGATYNDKAVALSFENHHREAVNIRKNQVMPIYTERLGDHPFTATILNNLSNNHRDLGQFEAAEEYAEQALRIRLELLPDHRDSTKSLFDLGVARKANGKFRKAKDLLEQCKTMQEKVVNDSTFEKNLEEELRDVNQRLLEMQQPGSQDQ